MSAAVKRDRRKPRHVTLKRALEDVLNLPGEIEVLAMGADPESLEWDGDGHYFSGTEEDFQEQVNKVRSLVCRLLEITKQVPSTSSKKRGRPSSLTELDWKILHFASEYANRTGKRAAIGATGKRFTNQGGPFVRDAAKALKLSEGRVISRVNKLLKNQELRGLWETRRRPLVEVFGHLLKQD